MAGRFADGVRQLLFRFAEFFARCHTLRLQQALLDYLGSPGLDCEIGLGEGDLLLSRIAILRDEIAGVSGQHDVVDLSLTTQTEIDHFPDVGKMVTEFMTRKFTGGFGLRDDVQKVVPFAVTQQLLEVTGEPEFDAAVGLPRVGFKRGGKRVNLFLFHDSRI